jgi:hypothetical protein
MDDIQESNSTFQEVWGMYARGAGGEVVEYPGVVATCPTQRTVLKTWKNVYDESQLLQGRNNIPEC